MPFFSIEIFSHYLNKPINGGIKILGERIRRKELLKRVVSAEEAAMYIKDGMNIGCSGFTPSGYPKAVPCALAQTTVKAGEKKRIGLFTGASVGDELDGRLARAGMISKRIPYQTNKSIRDSINSGSCDYVDMHLSHVPQYVRYGFLGNLDIALIEAVAITEEGYIVPSTSVGNSPVFVETADKVIVEINTDQPMELEGMADIYIPENPPNRKPIHIEKVNDRIGTPYIRCNPEKIIAVVVTDMTDDVRPLAAQNNDSEKISEHLIDFLKSEVKAGRLPRELLPVQSGVGSVANAVLAGLENSDFNNLTCYTEVIQDSMLHLLDSGKIRFVSGTSITPSDDGLKHFRKNINFYKDKIILRPQEISNNPEIIRRLGLISINTAIEVDIYGNVNSTHALGQKMINGIGGSGDFCRNAFLSIFTTSSTAMDKKISSIVPMVSHTDHTEHDVMVVVTEQGIADLRGLPPKRRARLLIEKCAHPDYKPLLTEYLGLAEKGRYKHTPHILDKSLSWHDKYIRTGTMLNS